jgi:hypothetical protein
MQLIPRLPLSCHTCTSSHSVATSPAVYHQFGAGSKASAVARAAQPPDSDSDADSEWEVRPQELDDAGSYCVEDDAEFTPADEAAFNAFMRKSGPDGEAVPGAMLSDLIMTKLQAKGVEGAAAGGEELAARPGPGSTMDATMQQIYMDVGTLLQRCAPAARTAWRSCNVL